MTQWRIKLHRSSQDNEMYFLEPFTKRQAWQDLILTTNHKDWKIIVRWNIIDIKRWENWYSEDTLSTRWKWSRGKVRRYLNYLETIQQIVQHKSKVKSTITIVKYSEYQKNDTSDSTTDGHQTVQQTDTNKNDKKKKNEKSIIDILKNDDLINERWIDILQLFVDYRSETDTNWKEKRQKEKTRNTNLRLKRRKTNTTTNFGKNKIIDYEVIEDFHRWAMANKRDDIKQYFRDKYKEDEIRKRKYRDTKTKRKDNPLYLETSK
jgi:hypothetical protein